MKKEHDQNLDLLDKCEMQVRAERGEGYKFKNRKTKEGNMMKWFLSYFKILLRKRIG